MEFMWKTEASERCQANWQTQIVAYQNIISNRPSLTHKLRLFLCSKCTYSHQIVRVQNFAMFLAKNWKEFIELFYAHTYIFLRTIYLLYFDLFVALNFNWVQLSTFVSLSVCTVSISFDNKHKQLNKQANKQTNIRN